MLLHWQRDRDGRHYTACLDQDLLGDWVLRVSWGAHANHVNGTRVQVFTSCADAHAALERVRRRRAAHGYHLATLTPGPKPE